jgi:hypothetical protein
MRPVAFVLVSAGALLVAAPALAQARDFEITPSITVTEEYTSNVDLEPDGSKESALVTRVTPGVRIRGHSARFTGAADAYPTIRYQTAGDDKGTSVDADFSGLADAEIARDLFLVETDASVSRQLLDNAQTIAPSNLETVQNYRVSPVLRNRFGSFATGELRYVFGQLLVSGDSVSDQTSHTGIARLSSGRDFHRLKWSVNGQTSEADRSNDHDVSRQDAEFAGEFAATRWLHLLGGVGYQSFEDGSSTDFDSPTWRVGMRLQPTRRLEFEFDYGLRDDTYSPRAKLRYDIGPRTQLIASYEQTLSTSQGRLSETLSYIGIDPETGDFIDSRAGTPFAPKVDAFNVDDATERIETYRILLRTRWDRNTFFAGADYAEEVKEGTGADEQVTRVDLGFRRDLSRKLSLDTSFGFEHVEFNAGQQDDEYIGHAGLTYKIYENATALVNYGYRTQDSTLTTGEYSEHRVSLGVRMQF